jgi:hypothetical protein
MFPLDPRIMAEDAKPEHISRKALVIVIAGMLVLVFAIIVPGVRLKLYDGHFREIRRGEAEAAIVGAMGKADTGTPAFEDLERYGDEDANIAVRRADIARVLTWRVRFIFTGVTWQVGLDKDGKAVAKHRFE